MAGKSAPTLIVIAFNLLNRVSNSGNNALVTMR